MTSSTEHPLVSLKEIRLTLGSRLVLAADSFTLQEGEICALMGPNGAGKSTLLRVILGLERKAQGQVQLFGKSLSASHKVLLNQLRRRVGYVPQQSLMAAEFPLTVREAVATGRAATAGLFSRLQSSDWHLVDRWMAELGISSLAQRCLNEISGGELRKVMIARAMAQEPQLLLLDEPTANLDMGWREQIIQTIQELYLRSQVGIILVCHELETLPACCKRVVLLNQGRIDADGPTAEIFTPERIQELYGCQMNIQSQGGRYFAIPNCPASAQEPSSN